MIGAETFSRILDWNDRTTCVLFGDGAGAVVLEAREGEGTLADRGVLDRRTCAPTAATRTSSTSTAARLDQAPSAICSMEGREVFRTPSAMITDVIEARFDATGITADDLDWFVPHQANKRIIDASADKLGIAAREGGDHRRSATATPRPPRSRWRSTSRAATAASRRAISCMIEAMGGGFTWGTALSAGEAAPLHAGDARRLVAICRANLQPLRLTAWSD